MRVTVLGAGMIGSAIAKDLAQETGFSVTAVDLNEPALKKLEKQAPVRGIRADLQKEGGVSSVIGDCDVVICAVPGFMGFETLRSRAELECTFTPAQPRVEHVMTVPAQNLRLFHPGDDFHAATEIENPPVEIVSHDALGQAVQDAVGNPFVLQKRAQIAALEETLNTLLDVPGQCAVVFQDRGIGSCK